MLGACSSDGTIQVLSQPSSTFGSPADTSSPPSAPSLHPSPAPAQPPSLTPAPSPSGKQFLYTADAGGNTISGFTINSDGSLTPGTGGQTSSPSIVRGATPNTLLVGNTRLRVFAVNASTGAIQQTQNVSPGPADLAIDASGEFAYQINIKPCQAGSCRSITVYRVVNGAVQSLGSEAIKEGGTGPYRGAPVNALVVAVDPEGRYVFIAGSPGPGPKPGVEFRGITRNADGTLGAISPRDRDLCTNVAQMAAVASGSRSFVYNSCGRDQVIQWTVFDASRGRVISSGQTLTSATPEPLAVDRSGHYLLAGDTTGNAVAMYAIDQTTGTLTQVQQIAAGNHPSGITFDAASQFVYVTNWGSNNLSAYRFSNGSLQPIGVYSTGQAPQSITFVKP